MEKQFNGKEASRDDGRVGGKNERSGLHAHGEIQMTVEMNYTVAREREDF